MARAKRKPYPALTDRVLGDASWFLSHAMALEDQRKVDESAAEYGRAAECAEQAACLLDADKQHLEAAIHRVSAASCFEKIGQYTRAVTLFHAALAATLRDDYRRTVEKLLADCLFKAKKEVRRSSARQARKPAAATR